MCLGNEIILMVPVAAVCSKVMIMMLVSLFKFAPTVCGRFTFSFNLCPFLFGKHRTEQERVDCYADYFLIC